MRKENQVRYSSAVGESWQHCEFKIKYCHNIFDDEIYREGLRTLLFEAALNDHPKDNLNRSDCKVQFIIDHVKSQLIFKDEHRYLGMSSNPKSSTSL